jgi:hypothetical protein
MRRVQICSREYVETCTLLVGYSAYAADPQLAVSLPAGTPSIGLPAEIDSRYLQRVWPNAIVPFADVKVSVMRGD